MREKERDSWRKIDREDNSVIKGMSFHQAGLSILIDEVSLLKGSTNHSRCHL